MNRQQIEQLSQIADAALRLYAGTGITDDKLTVMMDLEHAHDQHPLDLERMLAAATGGTEGGPTGDFGHDVSGIRHNMNRQTGQLEGCFVPRFALPA